MEVDLSWLTKHLLAGIAGQISCSQSVNKTSTQKKVLQTSPSVAPNAGLRGRTSREAAGGGGRGGNSEREMFPAICARCGKETMVPFRPSNDKPVFCRDCFQAKNQSRGGRY